MPAGKNLCQKRSMLTRSMTADYSFEPADDSNSCFQGLNDEDPFFAPPKFDVHHAFVAPKCGRVEKRAGIKTCNVAIRRKLPPARLDSMKNLFSKLAMDEIGETSTPEVQCNYCKTMKEFLYESEGSSPPEGLCSCADSNQSRMAQLVQRNPAKEPNICPTNIGEEEFSSARGPFPCRIVNPSTSMEWRPNRGRVIRAVIGAQAGLHYWTISGTMTGRRVYVFGYNPDGEWRYATANPGRKKVYFRRNSGYPSMMEVDTHSAVWDRRAFYLRGSPITGEGAYLVPAFDENLAIAFEARRGALTLVPNRRIAHKWRIDD